MNRRVSIYLDLVRFSAALAVFFSHISGQRFSGGLFWQAGPYGDEAVDVFFVLSGFVIAYVTSERETSLRSYAVARLARVYSVALPAVLATFLLDAAGRSLHPGFYSASWGFDPNDLALQFVASLTLTNNLWMVGLGSGSNLPFWSLSYEVWYYALFAAAVLAPRGWRIVASIAVALIAGPRILALFPLWLLGVGAYSIMRRRPPGVALGMILCFWAPVIWVGYEILVWHGHRLMYAGWGLRGPLMQDYLVGVLFAAHLIGFCAISSRVGRMLERMGGPIRWAAGATFTIYLFHLPVAQFLTTVLVWPPSSWQTRLIIYPGVLAVLFLIASVTERRKEPWRRFFAAVLIPAVQTVKSRS